MGIKMSTQSTNHHEWDTVIDICVNCGVVFHDVMWGSANWICATAIQPCCGKSGNDRWDFSSKEWKCTECGAIKPNNSQYLTQTGWAKVGDKDSSLIQPNQKRCTCGSAKL